DRAWIKRKISCGCVAGAVRVGSPRDAASILMKRLVRSRLHFSGSEPPYMPGLLTSQEMAGIVGALEQELRRNTMAAEADQQRDEATIITAARDLQLNPRPASHNSTAWIADCARRKHFIEISASRNEFYCGCCRRSGGPAELEAFCEEAV
uniref:hypothetical protein n=1 Tax=Bradyrhizobium elkanii TaxID=29448 RepID=UPI001AEBAE72